MLEVLVLAVAVLNFSAAHFNIKQALSGESLWSIVLALINAVVGSVCFLESGVV